MEDLDIETRTWRVGGDLVWNDWDIDVGPLTGFVNDNLTVILLIVAVGIAGVLLWRVLRRPPSY